MQHRLFSELCPAVERCFPDSLMLAIFLFSVAPVQHLAIEYLLIGFYWLRILLMCSIIPDKFIHQ